MPDVFLATAAKLPNLHEDDQLLHKALLNRGIDAQPAIWDKPDIDWANAPLTVIRSTWDYVPKRDKFVQWAFDTSKQTCLLNPAQIVLWNTDKTYLAEFAKSNIPAVPSIWLAAGQKVSLKELMVTRCWPQLVIKPVVGASGVDTMRVTTDTLDEGQVFLENLAREQAVMIQPYFESVETEGESSLIFIAGEFTHAIRKVPRQGDFKSQEEYGGALTLYNPTPHEIAIAQSIMNTLAESALYGRVDFIKDDNDVPCLSELELVEPSLYLRFSDHALNALADAIANKLQTLKMPAS